MRLEIGACRLEIGDWGLEIGDLEIKYPVYPFHSVKTLFFVSFRGFRCLYWCKFKVELEICTTCATLDAYDYTKNSK